MIELDRFLMSLNLNQVVSFKIKVDSLTVVIYINATPKLTIAKQMTCNDYTHCGLELWF